jgi:DNA-binding MarR family transcriptional regulator
MSNAELVPEPEPEPETESDPDMVDDAWSVSVVGRQNWLAFLAVSMNLIPQLDAHHKRSYGITHIEYMVLIMLAESENYTSHLSSLARRVNSSLSRLSHQVRRLERDGLVGLGRSSSDGRATVATLTPAGLDLLQAAAPGSMREVRRLIFDPLTEEQQSQLNAICVALLKSWSPDNPHPWTI